VCDAVYCGGNLPTFQVLCNVGTFPPQHTASHSRRLETSAAPLQNFQFWLTIKYYTVSPFERTPTIRNRKQMQLSHAQRSAWQMFQVKCLTDCGRSVCLTVAAASACRQQVLQASPWVLHSQYTPKKSLAKRRQRRHQGTFRRATGG